MTMSIRDEATKPSQEYLARRADEVRERMLERVSVLDERRQALKKTVISTATRLRRRLPLLVGVAVVTVAAGVLIAKRLRSRQARRSPRWYLSHKHEERSSAVSRALREAALAALVQALRRVGEEIALQSLHRVEPHRALPPPPPPPPRPHAGKIGTTE